MIQVLNMISFVYLSSTPTVSSINLGLQEVDVQTSNFELRVQTGHDGVGCGVWGVPQFENVPFRQASIEEYSFTETDVYLTDTTT